MRFHGCDTVICVVVGDVVSYEAIHSGDNILYKPEFNAKGCNG